jgi:hypothetical protein
MPDLAPQRQTCCQPEPWVGARLATKNLDPKTWIGCWLGRWLRSEPSPGWGLSLEMGLTTLPPIVLIALAAGCNR